MNKKFSKLMKDDNQLRLIYGGSASGKSYYMRKEFLIKSCRDKHEIFIYISENTRNSFDSFCNTIAIENFQGFNVSKMRRTITSPTGNIIRCIPPNLSKIMENFPSISHGERLNICMDEDIQEKYYNLFAMRCIGKMDCQITLIFDTNKEEYKWIYERFFYKRFFKDKPRFKNFTYLHTTYKDNKFLDNDFVKVIKSYKEVDKIFFKRYCQGKWA
jgi:phage terminase large subunit